MGAPRKVCKEQSVRIRSMGVITNIGECGIRRVNHFLCVS